MAARPRSLNNRLLLVTAVMLVLAFAVTIIVLDLVFRRSAEQGARELLELQIYALIGAAMPDEAGWLELPELQLEPRLRQPGSGLYAEIRAADGALLWRSPSALGLDLGSTLPLATGERWFGRRQLEAGSDALLSGLGISWELESGQLAGYRFYVAEDLQPYRRQLATFRQQLSGWFATVMLVLLTALWLALRAGLGPLRKMRRELLAIENNSRTALSNDYPRELAGVTQGLNTLLATERRRLQRYRDSLADLAHSLKTPLAVLRTEIESASPARDTLRAQLERMQTVVDYQLRRAAATGPRSLALRGLNIRPVAQELATSLARLHQQRAIHCELSIAEDCAYPIESADLYELLGNLMDNAWKWARSRIIVRAESAAGSFTLSVEDDGPGIAAAERERVLARGVRADSRGQQPGHGIGLAVVSDIVHLYGGQLTIDRSPAGGARFTINLPKTSSA